MPLHDEQLAELTQYKSVSTLTLAGPKPMKPAETGLPDIVEYSPLLGLLQTFL
jgi:hypothetical protein